MNPSHIIHYKNKWPDSQVVSSENSLDVFHNDKHVLAMRKNGAQQWICISEELGLEGKHDLAPIPKDARLYKMRDGKICKDEKYEERLQKRNNFLCSQTGKILSCEELEKKGYEFTERQEIRRQPELQNQSALEAPKSKEDDLVAQAKKVEELELVK